MKFKKRIYVIGLLCLMFLCQSNAQIVTVFNMAYDNGTTIPNGGTIEIPENGEVGINFVVQVDQLNGVEGDLYALTRYSSSTPPITRQQAHVFSGQNSFGMSVGLTLSDAEFNTSGGTLFGQFENLGGVQYWSGNYHIIVVPGPDCTLPYPGNRTTTSITNNSAYLDWASVSGASEYLAEYKLASSSTWSSNGSTNSTNETLTGLSPNSAYNWRVRSRCSNNEYGAPSPSVNFTTLADCNLAAPTGLNTTNINDISADISWNPVSSSTGYQVELKQLPNGSYSAVYSGTSTSHTLINLAFETSYRWRVRAKCANGSYSQNWSSAVQFTTLPECPEHLDKTEDVTNGQSDVDDSEITLHATNVIFSGGTAAYDTGTTLSLKPGFHAKSGSNFRAFIDGCTPTKPLTEEEPIAEEKAKDEIVKSVKIFPNPTHGKFSLESNEEILQWELANQFGNLNRNGVASSHNSKEAEIDISSFPTGIYFLKIVFKDGTMIRKTVLKD